MFYRAWPGVMSVDGTIPRSLQEKMIAFQRKSLKVDREVLRKMSMTSRWFERSTKS